ncbi:MAG: TldD/PmbA family protein [Turicibacter sp.]
MVDQSVIADVIFEALSSGADFAEIFIEDCETQSISMVGSKVDKANRGQDYGIGIRLFKQTNCVYGYTNDSSRENLLKTARELAAALKGDLIHTPLNLERDYILNQHLIQTDLHKVSAKQRIDKMRHASELIKKYDATISQSTVTLSESKQHILIANSEGKFVEDTRVRTRLGLQAVASNGSEMQTGAHAPGAYQGFEFIENLDLNYYANDAARIAKTMLNAGPCPSGKMPVVIDNGFGGVIFHEACGHGLEATSVAKGLSVFSNKLGEKVANELVTAIDDGTIPNAWGSLNIDDEGTKTQRNVLIENGVLKGYMIDKLNGRRMNMPSTGSGRRQNYRYAPTSRMTNTYIAEGPHTKEEMIANTEFGLYAKNMGGGSVNPATGDFNFAVTEGYIIRNGQIAEPVRGATLIGNGPEILHKIDHVGQNLAHAQGMCGSSSGSIPTNVGQPALRVSEMTVGGAKGE